MCVKLSLAARKKQKAALFKMHMKIMLCRILRLKTLTIQNIECLEIFPPSIRKLRWLEKLAVINTNISTLPEWIGELSSLTFLELSGNLLTALPESIGNLKNLKEISLDCNRIQTLPDTFCSLTSLESFEIGERTDHPELAAILEPGACFTHLPESFGNLSSLKDCSLWCTKIRGLPESFGNLKSLEGLSLQRDMRDDFYFPPSMKNLQALRHVSIAVSDQFPDFIGELKNLISLDISHNKLMVLPDYIGELVELQDLNLHSTWITELPQWIVNLQKLENLDISFNDIIENPAELLKKLPKLNFLSEEYNEYNKN